MKIMKDLNKFDYIFFAGLILWILETAAFGFNDEPINDFEHLTDIISILLVVYGSIGSLFSALKTVVNIHTHGNIEVGKE